MLRRPERPREIASSIAPSSMVSITASATDPWMFAHTTRIGKTRYTRRLGFRAWDASSQMSPVKSGSANTCARIVNVQGAARRTGKNTSRIERGPAPSLPRGDGSDHERADREQRDDDREQPMASERVRSVGDELRAPLLIGPVPAEPEHRELVDAREAVLDDLAARDERQPGVCDQAASAGRR